MWICLYCGSKEYLYYRDNQLEGFLCLDPECGRFNDINDVKNEVLNEDSF